MATLFGARLKWSSSPSRAQQFFGRASTNFGLSSRGLDSRRWGLAVLFRSFCIFAFGLRLKTQESDSFEISEPVCLKVTGPQMQDILPVCGSQSCRYGGLADSARAQLAGHSFMEPWRHHYTGAFISRIGFGALYTIVIIRNPENTIIGTYL